MAYEELSTVQDTAIIREKNKIQELVVPTLEEMWFRKSLMAVYEREYT